jgi:TrpR-related protein YerC/YecD
MEYTRNEDADALFEGIMSLNTVEEFYKFFEDICTYKELNALAQRFLVARRLSEGKNYIDVSEDTGASSATICRVNKCLRYSDGYRMVLERIKNKEK